MNYNTISQAKEPDVPAQAAPSPVLHFENASLLLQTFFTSSIEVQSLRRDLRRWFLANLPRLDESFGSSLEDQVYHYELVDELLYEISIALIENTTLNQPAQ